MSRHKMKEEYRRQQALEAERQSRVNGLKAVVYELLKAKKRTIVMIRGIEEDLSEKLDMYSELKFLKIIIDKIKKEYIDKLYAVLNVEIPAKPYDIELLAEEIRLESADILDEYSEKVSKYRNQVEDIIKSKHHEIDYDKTNTGSIKIYNSFQSYDINNDIEKSIKAIDKTCSSAFLQKDDKDKLLFMRQNLFDVKSKKEFTEKSQMVFEYELLKLKVEFNQKLFNELYIDYFAEYIIYIDSLNQYRSDKIRISPKNSFDSLQSIESELRNIRMLSQNIIFSCGTSSCDNLDFVNNNFYQKS